MTPTPVIDFGGMASGAAAVVAAEPIYLVLWAAAAVVGVAFFIVRNGRRAVRK